MHAAYRIRHNLTFGLGPNSKFKFIFGIYLPYSIYIEMEWFIIIFM